MFYKISDLQQSLTTQGKKIRLVLAAANDKSSLEAVKRAVSNKLISPILVGNSGRIKELAQAINFDTHAIEIIHEENPKHAAELSVRLVSNKKADILMKGNIPTADLLRAVLGKDSGLRTGRLLSHIALFEVEYYHKLFALTDAAMNIAPDLKQKIYILNNAVNCLNSIGISQPKVAIMAAVEKVETNMQATVDAALLSKMADRGQIYNCTVDGPLAFDNILNENSANYKQIVSDVAGDADLIVAPNIEAGNALYKSLMLFPSTQCAAILLGAAAPIVLTSRTDTEETKYNSILFAALSASKNNN